MASYIPNADEAVAEHLPDIPTVLGTSKAEAMRAEVDQWFADSFLGTALGATTETWNLAHAAKEDLKKRLEKHL